MLSAISYLLVAVSLALGAQAAPFGPFGHIGANSNHHQGRHFKANAPSRFRNGHHRSAPDAMHRAYKKYNWEIVVIDPNNLADLFGIENVGSDGTVEAPPESTRAVPTVTRTVTAANTAANTAVSTPFSNATAVAEPTSAPSSEEDSPSATSPEEEEDNSSGEVSAIPEENESHYLSQVTIGGQPLTLNFDTGSSDLWVFSTYLPDESVGPQKLFDPAQSPDWEEYEGSSWSIRYGDGSYASGKVGFDTVEVGDLTVTRQAVEVATSISQAFTDDENGDGLLGLGFGHINTIEPEQQDTFFENVMHELDMPLFTADLKEDESGTYEFGAIDASKYLGEVHFVDINSTAGFWQFQAPTYRVGDETSSPQTCNTCSPVIADTGTSLLLMDDEIVEAYYAAVPDVEMSYVAGGYTYPCNTLLPDFAVQIGDYMAVVKGADMTYARVSRERCFGGIQSNSGGGLQILGVVFFKAYFAIFDGGNMRLGVATQN